MRNAVSRYVYELCTRSHNRVVCGSTAGGQWLPLALQASVST